MNSVSTILLLNKNMKIKLLTIAFALAFTIKSLADLIQASFTPDQSDIAKGIVKYYSLYEQPTNAPDKNVWKWVYQIPVSTNTLSLLTMTLDATNLPSNCLLSVTADGISQTSYFSAPFFYDYPAMLANAVANSKPKTVTGLNAVLILK